MPKENNRHVVDIMFVIALFCIFVISSIFLISVGAKIYSKTMTNMDSNFNSRTAVAYVIEKIHQSDSDGNVSIGEFGGCPAVIIKNYTNEKEYLTYIYQYENELKELLVRSDVELSPQAGQTLLNIYDFSLEEISKNLVKAQISFSEEEKYDFCICIHSQGGNDNE